MPLALRPGWAVAAQSVERQDCADAAADRLSARHAVAEGLAGVEVPEGTAGLGFHGFERVGSSAKKTSPPAVVSVPPQEFPLAGLRVTPDSFPSATESANKIFCVCSREEVSFRCCRRSRPLQTLSVWRETDRNSPEPSHKRAQSWDCRKAKTNLWLLDARTDVRAFQSRNSAGEDRAAGGVYAGGPVQLFDERSCPQKLAVGSVENIEKTVAIGLNQQVTRLFRFPLESKSTGVSLAS